ncbi:MAG: aminoglycoside phosphotransferase family protein [Chloroflexota bacterium]|nr:aminoglycoside phosphotransferase family protein [Chloroflexota bacterium]
MSKKSISAVLDALGHAGAAYSVEPLPGSYSNFTHTLRIEREGAEPRKIVVRRYNPENDEEGHDKPACECHALRLLRGHGIPVPPPLLLDADGNLLGLPGIVTALLPGRQIEPPIDAPRWGKMAATNARMLARIHRTPFSDADKSFLMNDDVEVAWFIKEAVIPDYMREDPDGDMIWHLINEHWHQRQHTAPRFQHTDYWSGNILWLGDEISAVVDWEEAGYGDPACDVAYARMEYFLEGLPEAADTFLRVYQAETGWALPNLAVSELAASVRPMTDPASWFTRPRMEARYRQFIADAKRRLVTSFRKQSMKSG